MALTAKERHKAKLLEYIGNPDNDFPDRTEMAVSVLGFKRHCNLYRHFSPVELDAIENEAFEIRKKKTARERSNVYKALYKEAKSGNVQAAKEFLDRTEGKVTDKIDHTNSDGSMKQPITRIEIVPLAVPSEVSTDDDSAN